jgi:hypothetical protein
MLQIYEISDILDTDSIERNESNPLFVMKSAGIESL